MQKRLEGTILTVQVPDHKELRRGTLATILPEYAAYCRRYLGDEGGDQWLAQMDQPGLRMTRVDIRPTWVGVLDFVTRFPSAIS